MIRRLSLPAAITALCALSLPAAALGAAGDPDPSFSGDGRLTTAFGTTPFHAADRGNASAKDGSGRIYVAGTTPANGGELAVVRLTATGTIDTTFGANGIVTTDVSGAGSNDRGNAVLIDGSGNVVVAGTTDVFSDNSNFALARYTSSGAPDPGFGGGDGVVVTDFAGTEDEASAVALSGSNLVAAGWTDTDPDTDNSSYDFALASYTSTGAPDSGFGGGDGLVTTDFGSDDDQASAVIATAGPTIVAAGRTDPVSGTDFADFAVARYDATGAPDNSFDTDGRQTVDFTGSDGDNATALSADSTGRILVAGSVPGTSNTDFGVARLTTAGALDGGFDTDGKATVNFPSASSSDRAQAVAAGPGDSVIMVGQTGTENGSIGAGAQFMIAKLTSAGGPDTGFDTDGMVGVDFKPAEDTNDEGTGVLVDATTIVATGTGNNNFAAARLSITTGALDTTFGPDSNGKVDVDVVAPTPSSESASAVALQPDGKIVVTGPTNAGPTDQFRGDQDFGLARYGPDGSLDSGFGAGGLATTNFAGGVSPDNGTADSPAAVALQSDGKIVVAGRTDPLGGDQGDFALARYNPDGSLDTGFGTGGLVTTDFGGATGDFATSVAVKGTAGDPSFRIVAAGARGGPSAAQEDFAVAVYDESGAPDNGFDTDGEQTTELGAGDVANGVAIQPDGAIVAAGQKFDFSPLPADFALVRYGTGGAPDPSFGGGDGIVTTDFAGGTDIGEAVAVQDLGGGQVRIVVVGRAAPGASSPLDAGVAAYTTDGSLDASFAPGAPDGDGKLIVDLDSDFDALRDVAVLPGGRIVASGSVGTDNFGLVRITLGGALDPTFGGDGLASTAFGPGQLAAFGLAVQPDGKIVAAGGMLIPQSGSDFMVARYQADPPPGPGPGTPGTPPAIPVTPSIQPATTVPAPTTKKKKCKKGFVKKKIKGKRKCVRKKKRK